MEPVIAQAAPEQMQFPGMEYDESRDGTIARVKRVFGSSRSTGRRQVTKPQYEVEDLNLPLFWQEAADAPFIYDASHEVVAGEQIAAGPEPLDAEEAPTSTSTKEDSWGDLNIAVFTDVNLEVFTKLHAALLWRQLELLLWSKEANGATRKTILDWIFAPMEHTHSVTGKVKSILGINVPFSFELCCYVEEVDPDAVKDAIATRLQQIKQGAGHRIRASLH